MEENVDFHDTLEKLKAAVKQRRCISFEYHCENRVTGTRFGDPHAIFVATTDSLNVHIWKTGGVSTDKRKKMPDWRAYKVKHILNVQILDLPCFDIARGYAPDSRMYAKAIVKV